MAQKPKQEKPQKPKEDMTARIEFPHMPEPNIFEYSNLSVSRGAFIRYVWKKARRAIKASRTTDLAVVTLTIHEKKLDEDIPKS